MPGDTAILPAAQAMQARSHRYHTDPDVRFYRIDELISAPATDVSQSGLFVRTEAWLPINGVVDVAVSLPGGSTVLMPARVAHCLTPDRAREIGRTHGMGFCFTDPGERETRLWSQYLRDLATDAAAPHLTGDLSTIETTSILSMLGYDKRDGVLSLIGPGGASVRIVVRGGHVCDIRGPAGMSPASALRMALAWSQGCFEFRQGSYPSDATGRRPIASVLLEHAARRDEAGSDP